MSCLRHRSVHCGFWPALALFAGLASLAGCGKGEDAHDPATLLERLARAASEQRRVAARLSTSFPHAPQPAADTPVRRSAADSELRQLSATAHELAARAEASPTPENLDALGVAYLVLGDTKQAVDTLERAMAAALDDPVLASDLSAAYLERATHGGRPLDLVRALSTAERARRLAEDDPAAHFNRALAMEYLHLRADACEAWQRYLELEHDPAWRTVANEHLEPLLQPAPAELWKVERPRLLELAAAGQDSVAREIVVRFPQPTREYVEGELLASWADAEAAHDTAEAARLLRAIRTLATALVNVTGDPHLRDIVAAIDKAGPQTLAQLVRGHRVYRDGKKIYDALEYGRARAVLEDAVAILGGSQSPFAAWAELYAAVCLYWQGERPKAMAEFARLYETNEPRGYLTLLGYCDWMRGVIHHLEADEVGRALGFYQQALRSFQQARQQQNVASVRFLLAEHFALLGDTDQVWENLLAALALSDHVLSPRHLHTILKEAADAAVAQDLPLAALVFLNRAVVLDLGQANPGLAAEAYLSRALTNQQLGDEVAAAEDLAAARQCVDAMTDPSSRRRVEAQLLVAEGQILDPAAAIDALDGALAYYSDNSFDALAAQLYLARGRAHLNLDDLSAADADFMAGIEAYERLRPAILKEQLRISYFDQARELFDEMIRLQVDRRNDFERAFEFAERSRARELLATVARSHTMAVGDPAPPVLTAIRQALPADVVLLVYALLDDRLILWAVSRAEVVPTEVRLEAAELTAQVATFIHRLRHGSTEGALAEELYRVLIKPLAAALPAESRLVILPDKALHALPFAALVDPASGRYLVEDHSVAIAPSATILLRSPWRSEKFDVTDERVLVLGDPSFNTSRFPYLQRLPAALAEAEQIAAGYGQAWIFTGEEATREKLLELGGQASVVHLALHAVANEQYPLLSQLILAAADGDSGVVFAHELYGRAFPQTRLVVLAACRTGSGRISRGEGVLNLARPFLAAGVPAVVASLWDVDDEPSAALFVGFYEHLRAGATPIDALRQAQLELISEANSVRRRPAVWAGFEIFAGALTPLS